MKPQKFIAKSAKEALAQVRAQIGPDALILGNESTPDGVQVTAISEADLSKLEAYAQPAEQPIAPSSDSLGDQLAAARTNPTPKPRANTDEAMSTVNFQTFANDRHARATSTSSEVVAKSPRTNTSVVAHQGMPPETSECTSEPDNYMGAMVSELRHMRSFIRQQFSALAWVGGVRRTPAQAKLLKTMIQSGFSSTLARALITRLPDHLDEDEADQWLHDGLVRNLRVACFDSGQLQNGGVFALVGPTGVGKTTSAAKIAARFAQLHGVDSVGMISADVYRIAGQEQLARYGQLIGSKVLTAHDADELSELLVRLQDKKLVLIDTAGLSQRDPRVNALLTCIDQGPVKRMVVVSAAAQSEAIEETLEAYRAHDSAGVLLTKTDESCRLGGALDALIRHRLPLHAIGTGQRVPEDWLAADPEALIDDALRIHPDYQTQIPDIDLTMLMQRLEPLGSTPPSPEVVLEHSDHENQGSRDHA